MPIPYVLSLAINLIKNPFFIFFTISFSLLVKTYLLAALVPQGLQSHPIRKPWFFLLGVLIGSLFGDIAWIIKITHSLRLFPIEYATMVFFARISWAFLIIQYQSLALFIKSLTQRNFFLTPLQTVLVTISSAFALFFFYEAFFDSNLMHEATRTAACASPDFTGLPLEICMARYTVYFLLQIIVMPALITLLWNAKTLLLPKLLKKQLSILILYFITPYLLVEIVQAAQFVFPFFQTNLHPIVALSTILITCMVGYCIPKVIGMRFLNFKNKVHSKYDNAFVHHFKSLLEQFGYTNNQDELQQTTQLFFNKTFKTPLESVTLTIRHQQKNQQGHQRDERIEIIEKFLMRDESMSSMVKKHPILVYDELEFSNFYDESALSILTFMEGINADIFLPIYEKSNMIAYITVDRPSNKNFFYGTNEQDKMVIFAQYLGTIINMLHHQTWQKLLDMHKTLKGELAQKHLEINQYKDTIKSFLKDTHPPDIGILFYKNNRFVFGNTSARTLLGININLSDHHPLSKTMQEFVATAIRYKTFHTCIIPDIHGKKMVACAIADREPDTVIVILHHQESSYPPGHHENLDQIPLPTKMITIQETYVTADDTDPEIVAALQQGKKALRNQQIMTLLWHKLKNQNKIATMLGVNRSSVNRRCRKYNLT